MLEPHPAVQGRDPRQMGSEMVSRRIPGVGDINYPPRRGQFHAQDDVAAAQRRVLQQVSSAAPKKHQSENLTRFAGLSIGLASVFAENILSHPCVVLRRQCQVNVNAEWYHLTPFTLFPVLYNMQRHQSTTSLFKGIGSKFLVRGIFVVSEAAITEVSPLPREVSRHSSLKRMAQHVVLKGLSFIITTPFYAASLVETVQSEIASERPGVLDCVKEGFARLMYGIGSPQTTRMLPVWKLVVPTVVFGVSHYLITSLAQYTVISALRSDEYDKDATRPDGTPPPAKSMYETYYPELVATFTGNLLADLLLYPLETILHRLHLQGTRTIIDNTDTGLGVMPIMTRYDGFMDCLRGILTEEGLSGLFKGFGALVLQYTLHIAILRLTRFLFVQLNTEAENKARDYSDL